MGWGVAGLRRLGRAAGHVSLALTCALLAASAAADGAGRLAVDEARLEGGRLDLGALPEAPPLRLGVEHVVLRGLGPGTAGRLEADLRLADGGGVRLAGEVGPWAVPGADASAPGPVALPFDLQLEAGQVDAETVVPLLPREAKVESARGVVDVSGRLARAAAAVGVDVELDLSLDLDRLRIAGHEASAVGGRLRWSEGALAFASPALEAYGGTWRPRGTLTPGDPTRLDLQLALEGIHLQRLAASQAEAPGEPTRLDGELELRGPWRGGANWLEGLAGGGRLEARGGSVPRPGVIRAVATALLSRLPARSREILAALPSDTTTLREAAARFAVAQGAVHTEDFVLHTEEFSLRLAGRLEEDGALDLRGTATLTPEGVGRVLDLLALPGGVRRATRLPPIPVRVRGHLGEPKVRADAAGLPRALLAGLLGVPERLLDALGGAGTGS